MTAFLKGKKMRTIMLSVGLIACLFCIGCTGSGRTPDPVLSYVPGDGAMSCEELHVEMATIKREILLKLTKVKEREIRNRELLSLWFLIYPLAEIDTLEAEETEIYALNTRYNHLFMIAVDKSCPLGNRTVTVKKSGGRDLALKDFMEDELPAHIEPLAVITNQ
jgi:hypothetical protein